MTDNSPKPTKAVQQDSATSPATAENVLRYNIDPVVERYARDQCLSMSDAREHERELKRYFALVVENPGVTYGMCGPVDELWHTFLTFTLIYQQFCESVAGRFIHHFPNDNSGDRSTLDKENYDRFVADYQAAFGEEPPRHIWPSAMGTASGVVGCSTCRCCIAVAEEE